jgi:hypothetical protein
MPVGVEQEWEEPPVTGMLVPMLEDETRRGATLVETKKVVLLQGRVVVLHGLVVLHGIVVLHGVVEGLSEVV